MGAPLEIEHVVPEALGGATRRDNLWAACRQCNAFKGERTQAWDPVTDAVAPLFNPRRQVWSEHFLWSDDGAHRGTDGGGARDGPGSWPQPTAPGPSTAAMGRGRVASTG